MTGREQTRGRSWWKTPLLMAKMRHREDQVFLVLAFVIGALTGLAVVAFILLTGRAGVRQYPPEAFRLDVSCSPSWGRL